MSVRVGVALGFVVSALSFAGWAHAEPTPGDETPVTSASNAESAPQPDDAAPTPSWLVPVGHGAGLFVTLRLTEAYLYPDPFADTRLDSWLHHYEEAFTRPPKFDADAPFFEWDGDPWYINAVGHAAMGSELYLRARTCGHGVLPSVLFTAGSSVVWDYAFEGNGVRPSALDLVYTPVSGLAFGEFRYFLWTQGGHIDSSLLRGVVRGIADPFGELERWAGTPC